MESPAIDASTATPLVLGTLHPRTQKARGIAALFHSQPRILVPSFEVFPADRVRPEQLVGYFSRPCPMRPRHGFVDSRKISNVEEAQTLIHETLDADPEAEIVTMPLINAEYSGIWTPGSLTVGTGHDGATTGTSSWSLPSLGTLVPRRTVEEAGVEGSPYVELLWPHGDDLYRLVQLRDGPVLPQTINFIPRAVTVERIVVAQGDLLEWEKEMQAAAPGTVVYHPTGSLASHYAIHAVLNQIPVLIDREPAIGERLEPEGPISTKAPDITALRSGFALALRIKASYEDAAHAMLAGCHHVSVWAGKHDDLLGIALGFAYRLTVAAALGEMRHLPQNGRMRRTDVCRIAVYDACWKLVHRSETRRSFEDALQAFHGIAWVHGFGGAAWFFFAKWAAVMRNHLVEGDAELALQALNQLIHSAHNNGWGFNKFVPEATLDECARDPIRALVLCIPSLFRAHQILQRHRDLLSGHFLRYAGLLQIPLGEPNHEELSDEERRTCDWEEEEEEAHEPLARRPGGRVSDRPRQSRSRRISVTIVL